MTRPPRSMTIARSLRARGGSGSAVAAVAAALIALAAPTSAPAQQSPGVFTVDTTADGNDGECSTRLHAARGRQRWPTAQGGSASIRSRPGVYRLTRGPLVTRATCSSSAPASAASERRRAHHDHRRARHRSRVVEVPAGLERDLCRRHAHRRRGHHRRRRVRREPAGSCQLYNTIVEGNVAVGARRRHHGPRQPVALQLDGGRQPRTGGAAVASRWRPSGDALRLSPPRSAGTPHRRPAAPSTTGRPDSDPARDDRRQPRRRAAAFQTSARHQSRVEHDPGRQRAARACGGSIAGIPRGQSGSATSPTTPRARSRAPPGRQARRPAASARSATTAARRTRARSRAGSPAINAGDANFCTRQRPARRRARRRVRHRRLRVRRPAPEAAAAAPGRRARRSTSSRSRGTVKIKLPGSDEFFELAGRPAGAGRARPSTPARAA